MKKFLYILVAIPIIIFILTLVFPSSPESDARYAEEQKIKTCWKKQGMKSVEPDVARLVAGMCEKLEEDYEKRYGHSVPPF